MYDYDILIQDIEGNKEHFTSRGKDGREARKKVRADLKKLGMIEGKQYKFVSSKRIVTGSGTKKSVSKPKRVANPTSKTTRKVPKTKKPVTHTVSGEKGGKKFKLSAQGHKDFQDNRKLINSIDDIILSVGNAMPDVTIGMVNSENVVDDNEQEFNVGFTTKWQGVDNEAWVKLNNQFRERVKSQFNKFDFKIITNDVISRTPGAEMSYIELELHTVLD